jgi:hypothetical protein
VVPKFKGEPGGNAKVTVAPLVVMLPVTSVLVVLFLSVKVRVVTVAGSTGSLKVAVRAEDVDTFVAPLVGLVEFTVGGVRSGATPVVKVQVKGVASALPARSSMPVVSVTV